MSALREEGATTTDIADQFGITHQRVSRILRSPDTAGPTPAS
jgi:predicted transcriptional regulator